MRIAFLVNHDKTEFYYAISARLFELYGIESFWISTSPYWSNWLIRKGVNRVNILTECDDKSAIIENQEEVLKHLDDTIGVARLLTMDRFLGGNKKFVATFFCSVTKFLRHNHIHAVIGEQTWAYEIVAFEAAKNQGIKTLRPHTIRYPAGYFGFFTSYLENELVKVEKAIPILSVDGMLDQAPDYMLVPKRRKFDVVITKVRRVIRRLLLDRSNYTNYTVCFTLKRDVRTLINKLLINAFKVFTVHNTESISKPFVLLTLHKQPEHSIDVIANRFQDQASYVKSISKLIPENYSLLVKEHPSAIGDRSLNFYLDIKRSIPSVEFVAPNVSSKELLHKASLVVSISGTVCYEAALASVPSLNSADVFFNGLVTLPNFNPYEVTRGVLDLTNLSVASDEVKEIYFKELGQSIFPGLISDPVSNPACMSDKNIHNIANGIHAVLV